MRSLLVWLHIAICLLSHLFLLFVLGAEARKVYDEARDLLNQIINEKLLSAHGVVGFYPAQSSGDDILVYRDLNSLSEGRVLTTFHGLRQQVRLKLVSQFSFFLSVPSFSSSFPSLLLYVSDSLGFVGLLRISVLSF